MGVINTEIIGYIKTTSTIDKSFIQMNQNCNRWHEETSIGTKTEKQNAENYVSNQPCFTKHKRKLFGYDYHTVKSTAKWYANTIFIVIDMRYGGQKGGGGAEKKAKQKKFF